MSAYLCDPHHIGALASYVAHNRGWPHHCDYRPYVARLVAEEIPDADGMGDSSPDLASNAAVILARSNLKSVATRYPNDGDGERPGQPAGSDLDYILLCSQAARRFLGDAERNPVQVLKAVACLDYQSCEYEGGRDSTARKILNLVEDAAVSALPGYEDAEWGWPEPKASQARRVYAL